MNILKRVANLVVEIPDDAPKPQPKVPAPQPQQQPNPADSLIDAKLKATQRTIEELVKGAPGPNLDEVKVPAPQSSETTSGMPTENPDGSVDFRPVYASAKLPQVPFTAEDAITLISNLPTDLALETKRQTVKVTIAAMGKSLGVTPESIVTDAARKLAAVESFQAGVAKQASDYMSMAEVDIATLEAKIAERRKGIENAKARLEQLSKWCNSESNKLDDVAEFFSLDIPPSKLAPGSTQ
jgi:hypothetical protein